MRDDRGRMMPFVAIRPFPSVSCMLRALFDQNINHRLTSQWPCLERVGAPWDFSTLCPSRTLSCLFMSEVSEISSPDLIQDLRMSLCRLHLKKRGVRSEAGKTNMFRW